MNENTAWTPKQINHPGTIVNVIDGADGYTPDMLRVRQPSLFPYEPVSAVEHMSMYLNPAKKPVQYSRDIGAPLQRQVWQDPMHD